MKKALIVVLGMVCLVVLQNCTGGKKAAKTPPVSYEKDVVPIIQASCTPCHFPPDGKKQALNNYDSVKMHIDAVIFRVKLPKEDAKFMPWKGKKPALTVDQIAVLEKWQKQSMPK